jgi:hypothetical protein
MPKNSAIQGVEVAPTCCIVCKKKLPEQPSDEEWVYLAGSTPLGAMVCSKGCLGIAVVRHITNGRVDTAEKN